MGRAFALSASKGLCSPTTGSLSLLSPSVLSSIPNACTPETSTDQPGLANQCRSIQEGMPQGDGMTAQSPFLPHTRHTILAAFHPRGSRPGSGTATGSEDKGGKSRRKDLWKQRHPTHFSWRISAEGFCLPGDLCQRKSVFLDLTLTAQSKISPKSFLKGHNRDN